ncbi:MAG: EF-hand domain-containing protein, partial [Rhodopirellula sp.]|nr:EF-hand domain-containing protein [Rhodopirellula sp.]
VFIRVHLEVDGASFADAWRAYIQSLFSEIDTDNDGRLTLVEITSQTASPGGTTSRGQTASASAGNSASPGGKSSADVQRLVRDPDLWSADRNPFDKAIRMDELTAYLVRRQRGPFQSTDKAPPSLVGSIIGESLFQLLDTDENRSLSTQELANAMTSLHRRDLDDDGTFGVGELNIASSDRFVARPSPAPTVGVRPFATLTPGSAPLDILREIERRYATAPTQTPDVRSTLSRKLVQAGLGFEADVFHSYDFDTDGTLDRDELRAMIRQPHPTVELVVRLGKRDEQKPQVELIRATAGRKITVRRSSDGLVSIVMGDVQIEIAESVGGPDVARQYLLRQFAAADVDLNEYLEESEAANNDAFRASFDQFDEDGDGKLFKEELKTVVDSRTRAARSRTRMDVRNRGRDLFQILDDDRNSSLGRRELARAVERIELWDTDGDGEVSESEIPQLYQISFGPGQPQFRGVQIPGQAMPTGDDGAAVHSLAPLWFRKLDRNDDGELTRREFPGTRLEFQKLDQNSDRVIDTAEAEFVKQVGH